MIKYFLFYIAAIGAFGMNHCEANPQKPHELWWSVNEDKFDMFDGWLGDAFAKSRAVSREHVRKLGYRTMLDAPCGTCTEYFGYVSSKIPIEYTGLDITAYLVARAAELGIHAVEGSIEQIPFPDSSFDLVYIRHLLEHLDYYHQALLESIRAAKKEVLVIFFIPPTSDPDNIFLSETDGAWLYHNHYNREKLEDFILDQPSVERIEWQNIPGTEKEIILHIYLHD